MIAYFNASIIDGAINFSAYACILIKILTVEMVYGEREINRGYRELQFDPTLRVLLTI